jgi:chromosome partitioning protein
MNNMNPKMTASDAAACLGKTKEWIATALQEQGLAHAKSNHEIYFGHETAKKLFQFNFKSRVVAFHIVKGGTGKSSLAYEFAVRASLYGAKVLCVDMDQQANLTQALNRDAGNLPVMVDVLADHYPIEETIISVAPGIDLLPSRFENAMLDEIIRTQQLPLDEIYRVPFQVLKNQYDLIVVDCPPSLGQSVAACALSADDLVAPVTPEKFALSGLDLAYQSIEELQEIFNIPLCFRIVLNKLEARKTLSQIALNFLLKNSKYKDKVLKNTVRFSQEFPKVIENQGSVFDALRTTTAKQDIDCLTQALLGIGLPVPVPISKPTVAQKITTICDSQLTYDIT